MMPYREFHGPSSVATGSNRIQSSEEKKALHSTYTHHTPHLPSLTSLDISHYFLASGELFSTFQTPPQRRGLSEK
ncbi:hypothetical protein VNO78_11342 [Psophocarpus tetragonolobus]|uniref:Uncharacterized protein n=1 Tax=Psophocarpus tetragonolobus TaxID=3891 RepID=A0AAN9SMZ9_PSOTE